jgi:acyl transferase domain-containing protein/NAD(P)-dependent dehydrogenase (short-subunit alcohol dehydrogenase family)
VAALTPVGQPDANIAIAATRAGGVGILDLCAGQSGRLRALERLTTLGRSGLRGVRLDADDHELAEALVPRLAQGLDFVVLASAPPNALETTLELLKARGAKLLLEVVGPAEADGADAMGFEGLIAKGAESAGRVGEWSAFILLQRLVELSGLPVWVHGGVGLHTAAACRAAGAAGLVLDSQLMLCRETPLEDEAQRRVAAMDGTETVCVGTLAGEPWRVHGRPRPPALEELERIEVRMASCAQGLSEWRASVRRMAAVDGSPNRLLVVGQDAAFARPLAERFRSVGGVISGIRTAVEQQVAAAARVKPLAPDAPLARSHGTRYPIVQGPMTRVSDRPGFAAAVAEAGALPFLALAMMRYAEVEALLRETHERLGDRRFGVGILGFVPPELREEQLAAIRAQRPAYALIAGGRPDQAEQLEVEGISTYLHVPSPGLLEAFVAAGARSFVFEGRECGGHVGPLSSLVLWNAAIETLAALPDAEIARCHLLLAGGIHDPRSAAGVAALTAPLAARGARVGALMGTAYLFCREALQYGAITQQFQDETLRASRTALLETGPGHATRCADTLFANTFARERERLIGSGAEPDAVREHLERLNLGRLRIAAKGLKRTEGGDSRLEPVDRQTQQREGLFMVGQVATLRDRTTTLAELHAEVSETSARRLASLARSERPWRSGPRQQPANIAIVGMACVLPGARSLEAYWHNILNKVDSVREVPIERWDWRRYFDSDRSNPDAIYSKWGGFIDDVEFEPLSYGMPPSTLPSIEPLQLITLAVAHAALADAGYDHRPFARERTSVIIGAGGGIADLGHRYAVRCGLPLVLDEVPNSLREGLPVWTEDSFPGILLNVAAGRVANRLDLGGVNYTIDAACASSLAAVRAATTELEQRTSDMVLVGGADTVQNPFGYQCFSSSQALSPTGRCRPFDAAADGIAISEGVAVVVLKRLADAEAAGDRIYAVIKGVGASSDGRDRSLTAPRPEGQALALQRAYEKAGCSPAGVELVEAHGTGTVAGDTAEVQTLKRVFEAAGAPRTGCALGSVKSMIGHTKCTAGVAGLVKASLALHEKILPPTANVETPTPAAEFESSPFYVNTEARPWLAQRSRRRAAVSAFGFGGTNFHAVLEEYTGSLVRDGGPPAFQPAELMAWSAPDAAALEEVLTPLLSVLETGAEPPLGALSQALWRRFAPGEVRLAVVAKSAAELLGALRRAREALRAGIERLRDPGGAYFAARPLVAGHKLALLFPGQGSQRCGMLRELTLRFEDVRECFEAADQALQGRLPSRLSRLIFPPPAFTEEGRLAAEQALAATDVAQPALGAAGMGVFRLLRRFGVRPHMVAGHSYGEYAALCAAGAFDEADLYAISHARGRAMIDASRNGGLGAMAAVGGSETEVRALLGELSEKLVVANVNSPRQTVLSGASAEIERTVELLAERGMRATKLPVACAFHSPLVAAARDRLADELAKLALRPPELPVFSNTDARPYAADESALRAKLSEHLVHPVRFADELDAMYAEGARIFVEAGPGGVLTGLTGQTLEGRPHLAVAIDAGNRGQLQLLHALAMLLADGVELDLSPLFADRQLDDIDLDRLPEACEPPARSASTWLVNGARARPAVVADRGLQPVRVAAPVPSLNGNGAHTAGLEVPILPEGVSSSSVLTQYQALMDQFVETQRRVMTAFLRGEPLQAANGHVETMLPSDSSSSGPSPGRPSPPGTPAQTNPEPQPEPETADVEPTLLRIVSERTGYPVEMLDLTVPMEAELGLDSIKRTEIVAALSAELCRGRPPSGDATERLLAEKTLGGIVAVMRDLVGSDPGSAPPPAPAIPEASPEPSPCPEPAPAAADPVDGDLPRCLMTPVELQSAPAEHSLVQGSRILIVSDPSELADLLVAHLRRIGAEPLVIDWNEDPLLTLPFDGCVYLAGAEDRPAGAQATRLFLLAQRLADALDEPDANRFLLVVTSPEGAEGGALAGLAKALAAEWTHARVRVMHLEPQPATDAARTVLEEIAADGPTEVWRAPGRRLSLRARPAPLDPSSNAAPLDRNSVVLVTGGARGITSQIVRELAERYGSKFILVGRAELPTDEEPADTAGLVDGELKRVLIERFAATGATPSPRLVEDEYLTVTRSREIRSTLRDVAAACAEVEYVQADVTDPEDVSRTLSDVYARYRRLDAVIHGAGLIEDSLVKDKSLESFERVLATKLRGAELLAEHVRSDGLRLFVLFGSISGRFGNAGQTDYAAANEAVNKLALALDGAWSARVVVMNWGPWEGVGMVNPELRRRFERRSIGLITPEQGRRAFITELEHGAKGEVEIVLGHGPWLRDATQLPLLGPGRLHPQLRTKRSYPLDPGGEPFLRDHRLDGRPVLPAALALELLIEAAQGLDASRDARAVDQFRVQHGVIVDEADELVITAEALEGQGPATRIRTELRQRSLVRPNYQAIVTLGPGQLPAPDPVADEPARAATDSATELYEEILFQGPTFQGIVDVEAIDETGVEATLRPSIPTAVVNRAQPGSWLLDPVIVDSALQLAIVWLRRHHGMTPLPTGLRRLERFAPMSGSAVRCRLDAHPLHDGGLLETDITCSDQDGRPLFVVHGMEFACREALNRLAPAMKKAGAV